MLSIYDEIKNHKPGMIQDKGLLNRIARNIRKTTGLKSFEFIHPCQHGNFIIRHEDVKFKMNPKFYYIEECNFKTEEMLKYAYGFRLVYHDGCFYPFIHKR
jgi:hypothetical protein